MNKRRYIISFVLIVVLSLPFAAQLFMQVRISAIRNTMKQKLAKEQLTRLTIPVSALKWVKQGKEIIIGNRLFDIKTICTENDTAVVTGLYDEAEKKLTDQLSAQHKKSDSLNSMMQQLFTSSYDHSFTEQPVLYPPPEPAQKNNTIQTAKYSSPYTLVAAPPPWRA